MPTSICDPDAARLRDVPLAGVGQVLRVRDRSRSHRPVPARRLERPDHRHAGAPDAAARRHRGPGRRRLLRSRVRRRRRTSAASRATAPSRATRPRGVFIDTTTDNPTDPGHIVQDAKGLSMYYGHGGAGYIILASQGGDSFDVYDRGDNAWKGEFAIVDCPQYGTDKVTAIDGADVTNVNLGPGVPGWHARHAGRPEPRHQPELQVRALAVDRLGPRPDRRQHLRPAQHRRDSRRRYDRAGHLDRLGPRPRRRRPPRASASPRPTPM